MAEARRNWIIGIALNTVLLTSSAAWAQSHSAASLSPHVTQIPSPQSGSLSGKLTDLYSAPLSGVAIVLRNMSTGAEVHTTTAKNGAFRFAALDSGEYTLEADEARLGHGQLEGILVTGGIEAHLQAAMRFEPAAPALAEVAVPSQVATPATASLLPVMAPFVIDQMPASAPALPAKVPAPAHTAPSTISLPAIASISTQQLVAMPSTTLPATETITAAPAPEALGQAPAKFAGAPASRAQSLPERTALDIQSARIEPLLALKSPHSFALRAGVTPASAVSTAAASAMQSVALLSAFRLGPIAAAAQQADPAAPAVSANVTAAQLQALPISGRRWQEFLLDTPTAADSSQDVLRGGGSQPAEIAIDGAGIRLAFGTVAGSPSNSQMADPSNRSTGQKGSTGQSWIGGRGLGVSESAIHQVETVAGNVAAEGMHSTGGRTNVLTQSGGNELHGQGFIFDRQNTWGARNPFTQWVQNLGTTAAPDFASQPYTPSDHEIVWGIGMGSRIRLGKLFWFAALDSYRRNDPGLSTVKNPAEFFHLPQPTSPDVLLLSAQLGESQNQAYNDYLGMSEPGYAPAGLEQLASLLGPAPRTAAQWTGFGRVDWQAAERHHFTLEGIAVAWNAPGGGMTRVSESYGNHSFGASHASKELLIARWEAYLTPNLMAVTQGSFERNIFSARPDAPSSFEQQFLSGNFWGQLPQIVVDARYGFTIGNPSRFGQGSYPDEKIHHAQETVDWVRGKLLMKAGFELDHNRDATSLLRNQTGTYHYSNVASFIADALAFQKFGFADALDPRNPHNCGATNAKFGSQPCYSYYSQTMGPTNWHLSTNDWAGFASAQWQISKLAVVSAGLRWEREQLPPPIAALANPDLPLTEKLPSLGSNWGPRISLALGKARSNWPVLRFGYGMYYGLTHNATIEAALTQTGSLRGDLNFFMRPSDDCQQCSGGAPPFPYVFAGQPSSVVKPGVVELSPNLRNPEVHQAMAAIEEPLPSHMQITASAMLSLGRRLPVSIDTNFDPAVNPGAITYAVEDTTGDGPIKSRQITVPFYASWPSPTGAMGRLNPNYQQITEIMSRANSTYEAAMVRIVRYGPSGLSLRAHYTYAHAMDWNPDETSTVSGSGVFDPADFKQEYGVSNLDVRHSAAAIVIFESPWKLHHFAGLISNGWMLSGIGQFRSGMPYTMHTSGSIPEIFATTGTAIAGLGPGMNGSGGDNRVYGVGRNTFRYPDAWKADLRLAKRFDLGEMRQLELLAESFNLFNHRNVTQIETTGYVIESGGASGTIPTLCYLTINTVTGGASCGSTSTLTGTGSPLAAFGRPLDINATNFYRERQIQLGLRVRF